MHPQSENIDGPGGGQERSSTQPGRDGFNAWQALQKATDKKRANLIADIVGHPKGKPSVEELDYMNPSLSEDAIRRHLSTLQEVGVVEEVELEVGERLREYPYKFYGLTDDARDLFDQSDLFPEEPWQRQYESVEKTPRIRDVERMPRPTSE